MLKRTYAFIMLFGLFLPLVLAQDIKDAEAPPPISPPTNLSKFILSSNILSIFSGNSSINLSLEKPLSANHGLELDVNYYFNYARSRKDSVISHLNISTKRGFGALASYKFLPWYNRSMQFFIGPTVGYRHIVYKLERRTCLEVLPEEPESGICECVTLGTSRGTNTSRSMIAAVNVGFQTNYKIKDSAFFFKFHLALGRSWINPIINPGAATVTCPSIASATLEVERENAEINAFLGTYTNHTVQTEKTSKEYISINLKVGYAF